MCQGAFRPSFRVGDGSHMVARLALASLLKVVHNGGGGSGGGDRGIWMAALVLMVESFLSSWSW